VVRVGAALVAMELVALLLAVTAVGPVALVVGGPVVVATWVGLVVAWAVRRPLARLQERRAARWADADPEPGGLMSGFFEVSPR
jgi:uncharacterized oligopeptide transporter (OPT) family protein